AIEALVRQADRVHHPARRLPQTRGRITHTRLERNRLRDVRREGELARQRRTEHSPCGDRVERARPVEDRVRETQAAEVDHQGAPAWASTRSSSSASSTGPSRHTRRYPPPCLGTAQPKQAPKPQAIPASSASCAGTCSCAHIARTASS